MRSNNFDNSYKFECYNMFNCDQVGSMNSFETELAAALNEIELSDSERVVIRERVDSDLGAKLVAFSIRMLQLRFRTIGLTWLRRASSR